MLMSIVLTLTSTRTNTLPADLGRAVYAEMLQQIKARDGQLAQTIHERNAPVPFTCSSLLGARRQDNNIEVLTGQEYEVRVTGLWEPVSHILESFLLDKPQTTWTIHHHTFEQTSATDDSKQHPWAGRAHYEELAAFYLASSVEPTRQIRLQFGSPTAFKSNNLQVPIPMPNLVFGSLVDRWNAFSPIVLSPDIRRVGEGMVGISRYELRSLPMAHKNGALHIGGVGDVTYSIFSKDRYWLSAMNMLADFALYSGVGVQTATGMGQVRRV